MNLEQIIKKLKYLNMEIEDLIQELNLIDYSVTLTIKGEKLE